MAAGAPVDFGLTAADYVAHRAGFPDEFFERIAERGLVPAGTRLLDIGCGTGGIARGMAARGCHSYALDIAPQLIRQARLLDQTENLRTGYVLAPAEQLAFADDAFDVVVAGQCWHWFDGIRVAGQIKRILRPGGAVIIAHFDWLPCADNIVAATEALILRHNPAWALGGGDGFYPQWLCHLRRANFDHVETFSFDLDVPYSHASWRGRIRASAGVAASLDRAQVRRFDRDLRQLLRASFPAEPLQVPHRVFAVMGRKRSA